MTTLLFKCLSGSRMYGLHNEDSDYDYREVVMPSFPDLLWDNQKNRATDPHTTGEDVQTYTLLGVFKMLLKPSPNMVEMLYVPEKNVVVEHPLWKELLKNKSMFVTKQVLGKAFKGQAYGYRENYFKNKEHKMLVNYLRVLKQAWEFSRFNRFYFPLRNVYPLKNEQWVGANASRFLNLNLDEYFMELEDFSDLPECADEREAMELYTRLVKTFFGL